MQPENDNLKDFKIALGRQVTDLHKRQAEETTRLREKIEALEKSRAYLQARSSIETAKINRAYRARLSEMDAREKNIAQREYALTEREKKIDRDLAEKDSIIQKLNLRTVEIESDLMSEFNQKFRAEKHEQQRKEDEIEILKKNFSADREDFEKQMESLKFEIRAANDKRKEEHLALTSQFAVERGEFEREKFTMQQNIKALKNTVNALKDAHRQTVSEYEDKLKGEVLRASEGRSSLGNALEEAKIENESLRRKLDELRLSSKTREEELAKKHGSIQYELNSELQSKASETAMLGKSVSELKKINEDIKDSYNNKIAQLESVSRSMEIELRNSLSTASAENERLHAQLQKSAAAFLEKEEILKTEKALLEKDIVREREKNREMENKYSAQYLTLADEKRHIQELLEKEISSLKEKLIQRQQAMASIETAAARQTTGLQIKIAALEDADKNLRGELSRIAEESRKQEEAAAAKISELNMLVKEREKESALRFAELSEKKALLEMNLQNEKRAHAEDIEERDKTVLELKRDMESTRLEGEIRFNAAAKEKAEIERNSNLRAEEMRNRIDESENKIRIQGEAFAEKIREKDAYFQAKENDWQKAVSDKETALFQMRDEMQRKLSEKEDSHAAESDKLRATIMQNARKFQEDKEMLSGKIKEVESDLASELNAHRKEVEGLNALRVSEKDALNNSISSLNEKLVILTGDLEKSRVSSSELSSVNAKLAANLASEKDDKRNITQSFSERLLEKQDEIADRDRHLERLKTDFADMVKAKDSELSRLAEQINHLSAQKSESEEKLIHAREKIISENKALKEELDSLRSGFREEITEAKKKTDVLIIEKAAETDRLKQSAAALKSEIVRQRTEFSSAQDNLKKHYMDLTAEKDKAFISAAENYEKKFEELNSALLKKDAEIKKNEDALRVRGEEFKKEKAAAADLALRGKEEMSSQLNSRIAGLEQAGQLLREEIKLRENELNSEKNALEGRIAELGEKITVLRIARENDAAKAKEQMAQLANQLKIRDMKLKDETKKKQEAADAAAEEMTALKAASRRKASDYEKVSSKREEEYGKEMAFFRDEIKGLREEITEERKKLSREKQILADNFAERLHQAENNFDGDKIKLNNEIRELADINRALEEELSSIRLRLESFKSGMHSDNEGL
ncbi:MAG: hypothetical protein CVU78_04160 [Elusimicrobia bacterium HGW-Elusimicrobia-2]|nr:MAG: hypothetical protein CVU78_04160 [Elusimicrobia bacterium HGW-Elusimicrobia-2]